MSSECKQHIRGALFSKLVAGLVFGLSIVLTTGCRKLCQKYGVKEEQTYGPEALNKGNYIPSEIGYGINEGDNGISSLLHIAVEEGNLPKVKLLIEDPRIDLNATCKEGKTPIYRASELNKVEIVKLLIEDPRTDPNKPSNYGNTPIHIAAHKGHVETVQALLVSSTIFPNAKNSHNETALSISFGQSHKEVCKLLLADKKTQCEMYCIICYDHVSIDDLYITSCSHFFHKACLEQWHQTQKGHNKSCPTCKRTIEPVNLR